MKFLVTTIGTIGDINGFLGIAQMLQARGHDVTFITNPRYEPVVRSVGVGFLPVGTEEELNGFLDSPDFYQNSKGWRICLGPLFTSPMRRLYEIVAERYEPRKTVVVASCWSFGARIAHEKLGVPMATVHLETQNVRSLYQTPLMPPPMVVGNWVPRFLKRFQFWIADRWFIDPYLAPDTNAFREELGLPPVRRFLNGWWNSPQLVIGMYPDWFYPPQPDWPPQMVLTGFSNWDQTGVAEVPADVERFLDAGRPPIVFSAGSNNLHAHRFFEAAVAACRALGERGVLLSKTADQLPHPLPNDVCHVPYVPFGYLLGRARAIVHHGGRGTASPALAAGIPQVLTPMTFGQVDFAVRLSRLGVGDIVKPRRVSATTVSAALERLLSSGDVAQRCKELASRCADMRSLDRTCDLLEELIGTDRS